jgi:hypothetical protein
VGKGKNEEEEEEDVEWFEQLLLEKNQNYSIIKGPTNPVPGTCQN